MTNEEKKKERRVAYETALARSCEGRYPTPEQANLAEIEADEHIVAIEFEEWRQKTSPR